MLPEPFTAVASFLAKALGGLVPAGLKAVVRRFRRPVIAGSGRCPRNILERLELGASKEHITALIGPPHRILGSAWGYRFDDAFVQIDYEADGSVRSVALALNGKPPRGGFPYVGLPKPLGIVSLADLSEHGSFQFRATLRTEELFLELQDSSHLAVPRVTIGVLQAQYGALDEPFQWDHERNELRSDPRHLKPNWIGFTMSHELLHFDWSLGLRNL